MADATDIQATREDLASRIRELGGHRVLIRMARAGQILELACEMPKCYYQGGRKKFLPRSGIRKWQLSTDHYPTLNRDKGKLVPWNVRMGHVFCNNEDFGWRSRINALLKKGKSLEEIAARLNSKNIERPHGRPKWTAAAVRKEFIS